MLLMAEMIFHLTFEHGLKKWGQKICFSDVLVRLPSALDVVVVEDLLSNRSPGVVGGGFTLAILLPSLSLFTPVWGIK